MTGVVMTRFSGKDWTDARSHLYQVVDDKQRNDDGGEQRRRVDDDDDGRQHVEERRQPRSSRERQHAVDRLHVAREPVEDAADRRRVEEHHRSAQDVGQHPRVQDARRVNAHQSEYQRVDQNAQCCAS